MAKEKAIIIQPPQTVIQSQQPKIGIDKIVKAASQQSRGVDLHYHAQRPMQRLPINDLPLLLSVSMTAGGTLAAVVAIILVTFYMSFTGISWHDFFRIPHPILYSLVALSFLFGTGVSWILFLRLWLGYNTSHEQFDFHMLEDSQEINTDALEETEQQIAWSDVNFDLLRQPHYLVAGESGAGKTNTTLAILEKIHQSNPEAKLAILELGGVQWAGAMATETYEIAAVCNLLRQIMTNRQSLAKQALRDGVQPPEFPTIVVILEEISSALALLKLEDSLLYKQMLVDLTAVSSMARKIALHLIFTSQVGLSTGDGGIPTAIKGNLTKIVGRCPRSVRTALDVPSEFDMETARTGQFYVPNIRGLVHVPKMSWRILSRFEFLEMDELTAGSKMVQNLVPDGSQSSAESGTELIDDLFSRVQPPSSTPGRPKMIDDNDEKIIRELLRAGWSANAIAAELGGGRSERLAQIRAIRESMDD